LLPRIEAEKSGISSARESKYAAMTRRRETASHNTEALICPGYDRLLDELKIY
jgi:hypothetical protein